MTYEIIYRSKDEMKDSGIEWIGMIPREWTLKKIKYIARLNMGQSPSSEKVNQDGFGIPFLQGKTEFGDIFPKAVNYCTEPVKIADKGEILLSVRAPVGDLNIANRKYCIGRGLASISSTNNITYLYFVMMFSKGALISFSTGSTFEAVTTSQVENLFIPYAPDNEQQKIANFLDIKTAQFNFIISKKEKLIEKLEEAKKSLISEVVTGKVKIVDGKLVERRTEEMKDSGVEWLGMIPKDWEVKKLKHIISEPLKYGANELAESDDKNFPRYIRITDFGDDGQLRKETFKSLEFEKAKDYMLEDGDILFARSGATVGKTFQFKNYNGKACFAGYLIRAVPDIQIINSDYLYYYTKTYNYDNWKNSIFIQATIQNIGADKYKEIKVCIPSINEQEEIVLNISEKIEASNQIISKTKLQIEKLKSAKQSLIAEAVTGKIDLRDWEIMRLEN